ncbi:response regulator [Mycoplasmatota bacterium WC44]
MNILIIEEDPMVREIIVEYTKDINSVNDIYTSNDIDMCKEKALSGTYQLLIVDIKSYNNKGLAILKELRDEMVDIEVIVVSSENNVDVIKSINRYGISDYILKPFSETRLKSSAKRIKCQIEILKSYKYLNQEIIDELYSNTLDCDSENIRGINCETYNIMYQLVKGYKGLFTTKDITENSNFSRITVRRYLEYMKEQGVLVLEQQYGKVGRPTRFYRLNPGRI